MYCWQNYFRLWGVHYMHICTQINNGNNDPIKVFMTFICDDGMKNKNRKEKNRNNNNKMRKCNGWMRANLASNLLFV